MSYTTMRRLGAALPWPDLPILTRAAPAVLSLLLLLAAGVAQLASRGWLVPGLLLWAQLLLMACGAHRIAATAHDRLLRWERRAAPAGARQRVRVWLLRRLGSLAVLGMAGPLVLAAVRDGQAGELRWLPGMAALLAASLAGGLVLSLSWRGRAPRVLVLPALGLLVFVLFMGGIKAVVGGDPRVSLAIVAGAGLLGGLLLRTGALSRVAPPLPRLRWPGWLRRIFGRMFMAGWGRVPYPVKAIEPFVYLLNVIPVFVVTSSYSVSGGWLRWGQRYDDAWLVGGYGLLLVLQVAASMGFLMAPPLLWRHRLAPNGMTARRWARALVCGSLLFQLLLFGLMFAGAAMTGKPATRPDAAMLVSAAGDWLLASSIAALLRGRSPGDWGGLPLLFAPVALLTGLYALGIAPQRGPVWLLVQMALTLAIARVAIRAWERQDLNALAKSIAWSGRVQHSTGGLNP